ncbi:FtsK/SpoIIIE domain-containing protein [Actinoplanes sp. NPDC004185]
MELTDEISAALNAVSGKEDLARCLKKLWILADKPSYRELSTRARNHGLPLSKTTIGQLLNGNVFPRRGFLIAFLTCCGVGVDDHLEWERAWTRLAPRYYETPASPPRAAMPPPPVEMPAQDVPADESQDVMLQLLGDARGEIRRMSGQIYQLERYLDRLRQMVDPSAPVPDGPVAQALRFTDLVAGTWWSASSADGLSMRVGVDALGAPVDVRLGDRPPHGLIGGPSGSGKTNVIFALLAGLCTKYSPSELELYLLDFKEGVSFNRLAPDIRTKPWLPHARLVGININSDQEFGLAMLRHLHWEMRRRAAAAKKFDATTIRELRLHDPTGHWPRILAVVDEFQVMLAGRNGYASECAELLEDVARRGRAMGVHLLLASQDIAGTESLWGRPALVQQLSLRIALPRAQRVLSEMNQLAERIPRDHAAFNEESGAAEASRVTRVPYASGIEDWSDLRHRLWQMRSPDAEPPVVFDGDVVPRLDEVAAFRRLTTASRMAPAVAVGHAIDVADRPAFVRLDRRSGRNLAVVGNRDDIARAVIRSAVRSLTRQFPAGEAHITLVCPDNVSHAEAIRLRRDADRPDIAICGAADLGLFLDLALGGTTPHFLVLYAVDEIWPDPSDEVGDLAEFRRVLDRGPRQGTHVIGWWRSASRFQQALGLRARHELVSSVVVAGGDVPRVGPDRIQHSLPQWMPRQNRALLIDVEQHPAFETVIPYAD